MGTLRHNDDGLALSDVPMLNGNIRTLVMLLKRLRLHSRFESFGTFHLPTCRLPEGSQE